MPQPLPPSDDNVLRIFLDQIVRQAEFALMSAGDLCLAAGLDGSETDVQRVWSSAQAFLGAVANLSKLLWPYYRSGEQRFSDRGERLRQILNADDLGVLRDRDLRNDFEHFDARLEEWAATIAGRPFIDGNINAHLMLRDIPQDRWLRNLETEDMALTFRGRRYRLEPIVEAIHLVRTRALVAASVLGRGATPS